MKNTLNKGISTLTILLVFMTAPTTRGMSPMTPGENSVQSEYIPSTIAAKESIMLAANDENTTEDKTQTPITTKNPVSEPQPGPATDRSVPSAESKTAPLKPFKPSEEIAAEQAVDFPVDI